MGRVPLYRSFTTLPLLDPRNIILFLLERPKSHPHPLMYLIPSPSSLKLYGVLFTVLNDTVDIRYIRHRYFVGSRPEDVFRRNLDSM